MLEDTVDRIEFLQVYTGKTVPAGLTGAYRDFHGGSLDLEETKGGLKFSVDVVRRHSAANGGLSGMAKHQGEIANYREVVEAGGDRPPAQITFDLRGGHVVKVTGQNTGYYHGAGAYFDGEYYKVGSLTKPIDLRPNIERSRAVTAGACSRFSFPSTPFSLAAMEIFDAATHRKADHPIEKLILSRWSPRAMSGEPITSEEMLTLFEAARWAPSTYNVQEWRFLYALRETPEWQAHFDLLVAPNQAWCRHAAMLVVILGHKIFPHNGKPNPVHLFDCGSAFENLALQGTAMGLVVHGMSGFDYEQAAVALQVPFEYAVVAMFAVGRPGPVENLGGDAKESEMPSGRHTVSSFIAHGSFAFAPRPERA